MFCFYDFFAFIHLWFWFLHFLLCLLATSILTSTATTNHWKMHGVDCKHRNGYSCVIRDHISSRHSAVATNAQTRQTENYWNRSMPKDGKGSSSHGDDYYSVLTSTSCCHVAAFSFPLPKRILLTKRRS